MTAAALAASAAAHGTAPRQLPAAPRGPAVTAVHHVTQDLVRAPVRIADAAAVALLHPGDRVDVLANVRIVAANATVVAVPEPLPPPSPVTSVPESGPSGALVVLAVPRRTAAALSGAAISSPLAVTLC